MSLASGAASQELAWDLPRTYIIEERVNFLLAMAEGGKADYLVTGDKRHLLSLRQHKGTSIVSAREGARMLGNVESS